ncbi:hypothetical protein [Streptomyces sp. NPDC005732]|uniref:hypothetical protein n=1 Tax=Streptomyces sp. NPDC005732 TaxID=3157057 RepID=UPI0033DEA830
MTRTSRALHVAYGVLFSWLTWCAAASAYHHAWLAAAAFTAGTALLVTAMWREGLYQDALQREGTHVCPSPHPMRIPLSGAENAAFQQITAHYDDEGHAP